MLSVIL